MVLGLAISAAVPASYASWFSDLVGQTVAGKRALDEIAKVPACSVSAEEAYVRSVELLSDGRQAEAEELIDSAVKSYDGNGRILFAKAVLERSRWNIDTAEVWFRLLRRIKNSEYLSRVAELNLSLDQNENVAANMDELVRISDEHPDDLYLLWLSAFQCRHRNMDELGKIRYEKLISKFRVGPVLMHQTFANILDELGLYDEALPHRNTAVILEYNSWSLRGLANTLFDLEKYDQANAVQARLVHLYPCDDVAWSFWGYIFLKMERFDEAVEKYREAIHLNPRNGYYFRQLAFCLGELKQDEEMATNYQKAVDLGYDNALDDLGWCYQFGNGVDKNPEKAFELYSLCVEKTDSVYARYRLGDCYADGIGVEKDSHKAKEVYEEVLRRNPDHRDVLNALAWMLATDRDEALHDYPRAVSLAEKVVELGANRYNLDTLIVAYEKNGQIADAVRVEKRLIEQVKADNPGTPVSDGEYKRLSRLEQALAKNGGGK